MLNNELIEKIKDMIDECSQKELQFDTDNITNDGWEYIENTAQEKCLKNICEDFNDDLEDVDKDTVKTYFNKVINTSPMKLREYDN